MVLENSGGNGAEMAKNVLDSNLRELQKKLGDKVVEFSEDISKLEQRITRLSSQTNPQQESREIQGAITALEQKAGIESRLAASGGTRITEEYLDAAIAEHDFEDARRGILQGRDPAHILGNLSPEQRSRVWSSFDEDAQREVRDNLSPAQKSELDRVLLSTESASGVSSDAETLETQIEQLRAKRKETREVLARQYGGGHAVPGVRGARAWYDPTTNSMHIVGGDGEARIIGKGESYNFGSRKQGEIWKKWLGSAEGGWTDEVTDSEKADARQIARHISRTTARPAIDEIKGETVREGFKMLSEEEIRSLTPEARTNYLRELEAYEKRISGAEEDTGIKVDAWSDHKIGDKQRELRELSKAHLIPKGKARETFNGFARELKSQADFDAAVQYVKGFPLRTSSRDAQKKETARPAGDSNDKNSKRGNGTEGGLKPPGKRGAGWEAILIESDGKRQVYWQRVDHGKYMSEEITGPKLDEWLKYFDALDERKVIPPTQKPPEQSAGIVEDTRITPAADVHQSPQDDSDRGLAPDVNPFRTWFRGTSLGKWLERISGRSRLSPELAAYLQGTTNPTLSGNVVPTENTSSDHMREEIRRLNERLDRNQEDLRDVKQKQNEVTELRRELTEAQAAIRVLQERFDATPRPSSIEGPLRTVEQIIRHERGKLGFKKYVFTRDFWYTAGLCAAAGVAAAAFTGATFGLGGFWLGGIAGASAGTMRAFLERKKARGILEKELAEATDPAKKARITEELEKINSTNLFLTGSALKTIGVGAAAGAIGYTVTEALGLREKIPNFISYLLGTGTGVGGAKLVGAIPPPSGLKIELPPEVMMRPRAPRPPFVPWEMQCRAVRMRCVPQELLHQRFRRGGPPLFFQDYVCRMRVPRTQVLEFVPLRGPRVSTPFMYDVYPGPRAGNNVWSFMHHTLEGNVRGPRSNVVTQYYWEELARKKPNYIRSLGIESGKPSLIGQWPGRRVSLQKFFADEEVLRNVLRRPRLSATEAQGIFRTYFEANRSMGRRTPITQAIQEMWNRNPEMRGRNFIPPRPSRGVWV